MSKARLKANVTAESAEYVSRLSAIVATQVMWTDYTASRLMACQLQQKPVVLALSVQAISNLMQPRSTLPLPSTIQTRRTIKDPVNAIARPFPVQSGFPPQKKLSSFFTEKQHDFYYLSPLPRIVDIEIGLGLVSLKTIYSGSIVRELSFYKLVRLQNLIPPSRLGLQEKWIEAMKNAANLAGWELNKTANGDEYTLIQIIVDVIFKELCSTNWGAVDGKLVGMEMRIKDVLSSLEMGTNDVRMIGIKGMGGGGKTTLARAVYDQIFMMSNSIHFDASSFVENEVKVFNILYVRRIYDVDNTDQLEALSGDLNWFRSGSRVIITTRDEQVLVAHRVNVIHKVNLLSHAEAICLLKRYSFGKEIPFLRYKELLEQVVQYAVGLPLTIKVLGSFLCGQNEPQWIDALERLKTIPLKATMEKLEISYIGLEEDYKEIFLDVACLLKGWWKEDAIKALESRGFRARNGLRVLEQKSLITISSDGKLGMHDHIEEMGRNIVRRMHPNEPDRHSRLWILEEIADILANDQGNQVTECITLTTSEIIAEILMKGLGSMKVLRFLNIFSSHNGSNWKFDEVSQYLPNALRFLRWHGYPFRSLPKTFQANNLVALDMYSSDIIQLWEDVEGKVLNKLRFLKFNFSNLMTLDLTLAPNLEILFLHHCHNLVELHMGAASLKLISLDLSYSKVTTLHLGIAPNLKMLRLEDCHHLAELHMPTECLNLTYVVMSNTKLTTLALGNALNLEVLSLEHCHDLLELHMPADSLKPISIDLSLSRLRTLDLRTTQNLKTLSLYDCHDLVEIYMPPESLKLISLDLFISRLTTLDLRITPNLETLHIRYCHHLVELHMPAAHLKLKYLDISHSKLRFLNLGITSNLETLSLRECDELAELCMPVDCPKLQHVVLSHTKLTTLHLGIIPNLETLIIRECNDLVELHMPVECLKLEDIFLSHTKLTDLNIGFTPNLEMLTIRECDDLVELLMAGETPKLKYLHFSHPNLRIPNLEGRLQIPKP
ncbi:Toll/interleukin-1 receptor domain-containing protein [Tanacetum coccineum]|uniref:Toll/interleukin-1 receptor domain-containing protein n=1 Tax=Tanacetum coccineum TaxID=301880 RepID=A0ABQ5AEB3_9ASTR